MFLKLDKDEQELFDLLISSGLKQIISIAKENDRETFLHFLIEIQCLLMKLGYDFKFEIKEIRK